MMIRHEQGLKLDCTWKTDYFCDFRVRYSSLFRQRDRGGRRTKQFRPRVRGQFSTAMEAACRDQGGMSSLRHYISQPHETWKQIRPTKLHEGL